MGSNTYSFKIPRGSSELKVITKAINQGIDSRLNAVFFSQSIDRHFVAIEIADTKSLSVLMYRLWENGQEDGGYESEDMFFAICETLGLEDPWLVDSEDGIMPEIYYGSYKKVGAQFIAPLDKVVTHCLDRGSAPTDVAMQARG
jgi:hypothetical protein